MTQPQHSFSSASIYVGDLATEVSEGILFEIFKRVGAVSSIRVCRDSITKRSLGYAYVNFVNVPDAQRAIDTLNNTTIKGRTCRIMWSIRDPSVRKSGLGNIFIRNLDLQIGPKELHDTFSQFGNIISCKVASYPNGQSKGYGYVHFENASSAEQAIKIVNGKRIGSETVQVTNFIPRTERIQRIEQTWTNVYVKDLDISISKEDLLSLFSKYGEITSCVVMKKDNGESRGFGFINFKNHKDAIDALQTMDKIEVNGKQITCCRAQKKTERQAELKKIYEIKRRERIHKYQGLNVYVKNIEDHISEDRLRQEFEPFGTITSLKIMTNEQGLSKGFGFVCFSTAEEAQLCVNEIGRNRILPGCSKPLYVAIHEPRETRNQRFTSRGRNPKVGVMPQQNQMYQSQVPQGVYQQQVYFQPVGGYTQGGYRQPWPPNQYPPNVIPGNPNVPHGYTPMGGMPSQRIQGNPKYVGVQPRGNPQGGNPPNVNPNPNPNVNPNANPNVNPNTRKANDMDEERNALGQRILSSILEIEPKLASRITGMIIYNYETSNQDLLDILSDRTKLESVVVDARNFIYQQQQQQAAQENGDDDDNL